MTAFRIPPSDRDGFIERLRENELFQDMCEHVRLNAFLKPNEVEQIALAMFLYIESSVNWFTDCLNCSNLMDVIYNQDQTIDRLTREIKN